MPRLVLTALTVAMLAVPAVASSAMAAPTCGGLPATILGNPWSEFIVGTLRADVIVARGGHDTILALGGDDVVCAGSGRDIVLGGRGADRLFGENGNDRLFGDSGFDALDGGDGRDRCRVGRDGGTETNCGTDGSGGDFDLAVNVSSDPTRVNDEEEFEFSVVVRNMGNAPSGEYTLAMTEDRTNAVCTFDPAESVQMPSLGAGQSSETSYVYDEGCHVQSNSAGHVELTVVAQHSGADTDASNNSDSASVRVDPPSIG